MAVVKNTKDKCSQVFQYVEKENTGKLLVSVYTGIACMENSMNKVRMRLPYHPAIPLLGVSPKDLKSRSQ